LYRRTSKNRKKAEKKRWSLKEGSAFEDLALVDALAKIMKQVEETRGKTYSKGLQ